MVDIRFLLAVLKTMVLPLLSGRSIARRLPHLPSRLASLPKPAQRPRVAPFLSRTAGSRMSFHFGSSDYAACFLDLPQPDTQAIRQSALTYLKSFDAQLWYNDPVSLLLAGCVQYPDESLMELL